MKNLPVLCPGCEGGLHVQTLTCAKCGTSVNGTFELPGWAKLSAREQQFVLEFVMSSGSLKHMSEKMVLSYPTVRNMLNVIIRKMER